jgi:hypothetical protein
LIGVATAFKILLLIQEIEVQIDFGADLHSQVGQLAMLLLNTITKYLFKNVYDDLLPIDYILVLIIEESYSTCYHCFINRTIAIALGRI